MRKIKILFLAANPSDTTRLRIDEEIRIIDQKIREGNFRDAFDLRQHGAVRVTDLHGYLLRHRPHIVHFSGHGSSAGEIILEDESGISRPVPVQALSRLFSILKDEIRCVVLNSCYSEPQASEIARHIDCVIGMSKAISDTAAMNFSAFFYHALGYGRSVKTAFDLGVHIIDLSGTAETDIPKLICRNANPEKIVFASPTRGGEPAPSRRIVEFMQDLLEGDENTRLLAAQRLVLSTDVDPSVLESLAALIIERSASDPSATVRQWLNHALGELGSPEAVETLRSNTHDSDDYAAMGAQQALAKLGHQ